MYRYTTFTRHCLKPLTTNNVRSRILPRTRVVRYHQVEVPYPYTRDENFRYHLERTSEQAGTTTLARGKEYVCPQCNAPRSRFAKYDVETGRAIGGSSAPLITTAAIGKVAVVGCY